jgi:hypothetical protein
MSPLQCIDPNAKSHSSQPPVQERIDDLKYTPVTVVLAGAFVTSHRYSCSRSNTCRSNGGGLEGAEVGRCEAGEYLELLVGTHDSSASKGSSGRSKDRSL